MGFRPEKTIYRLKFEDDQFRGLEVSVKSMSLKGFFEMAGDFDAASGGSKSEEEVFTASQRLFSNFTKSLVHWNLEDEDGNEVPRTLDGLQSQEMGFVIMLISTWMQAISSVPDPLSPSSNGTRLSLEDSMMTAPVSLSRAS